MSINTFRVRGLPTGKPLSMTEFDNLPRAVRDALNYCAIKLTLSNEVYLTALVDPYDIVSRIKSTEARALASMAEERTAEISRIDATAELKELGL